MSYKLMYEPMQKRIVKGMLNMMLIISFIVCLGSGAKADSGGRTESEINLEVCFQDINGCAVIYDTKKGEYSIYNRELAEKRSSPCSTFKIISAAVGLKTGAIEPEEILKKRKGIVYPFDDWNKDMTLKEAFQTSCVWYFRDVIDRIGKEAIDEALNKLSYGNCDTTQWSGSGVNGEYAELNGFWLESSLLVSPMEQVESLLHIFSDALTAGDTELEILKDVMFTGDEIEGYMVYGKTGTGYAGGRCVDAWFVGFAESGVNTYYFSVRLDDPDNPNVSGKRAKEIALDIIKSSVEDSN